MQKQANLELATRLIVVAVGMFVFGVFAMPPLYDRFCEITGFGQRAIEIADAAPLTTTSERVVRVRFDATTNSGLNWEFKPIDRQVDAVLGTAAKARYFASNLDEQAVAGRAVFNVTPSEAGKYFVKTECFCFTRQLLQAHESREMPVFFYVREDLPAHIEEITLSYTFFKNIEQAEPAQAAP